ncbi:unnamed protein product, partial [Brenthis ino]
MYFQIENTPERIKRARKKEIKQDELVKEECPRLILAPFSKSPQVVFDNVLIGTTCEKYLEVLNPTKNTQQITLGKALPPGLIIQLPGDFLEVEPETCYCLSLLWTPTQLTALRETIRFTNENRGRYDVIVVLKSVMSTRNKNNQPKFKISPGKIKKKVGKRSPVAIYKKKVEAIMKVQKTVEVVKSSHYKVINQMTKENIPSYNNYLKDSNIKKCPFDSPTSIDLSFNTSEIFSNVLRQKGDTFHQTYDKSYSTISNEKCSEQKNILKPSNKQICDTSASDIFDNLTFTPLKSVPSKSEKLDKGPKIILSVNSESDFDDSLDMKSGNKENETHSIICITSSQPPNKWLTVDQQYKYEKYNVPCTETPTLPNKKIPNTSSPKEFNSPNFSINTEFSRISDLSFFPQRFSTERKIVPKINNETHEIIDDSNINLKLSSDTYTKESPFTPFDYQMYPESRPFAHLKEPPAKICRQALFKEYQQKEAERNNYLRSENFLWHNDLRADIRSPPRSLTPPLQSIPEESGHFSEMQVLDNTNKQMATFTIDRTFEKPCDKSSASINRQTTWSKRAVRAEPELWKIPTPLPKKSLKPKMSIKSKESLIGKANHTFDKSRNLSQSTVFNHFENVYSQSFTVDPFLSSTYFYDEEAVDKFESEFKRWLNYILTPPADLDSNVEQKIDVGKAWIENRNKEVPAAPTKEQVSSIYHNSQRLESLRRSARALLLSPEISQVFMKLNVQIEKKLITIRTDRNLHLDVGLQKIIMELLLSYNPLWLRIGLEAIYGLVLPLKSNSDIEGLTTFIIQRMFKNPHLKNKHSKATAPNMLLPAYMEAIKKFTLKKFFMLVFFLDQAKQRKIISHDPCLFCRNAVCKESREIVIRFTRELIAGIGDITKHLRPLGYVVSHKQSYLDEYKYAVHNIATDIRDGVRLTKVMEIILMKNGLLSQLRTPAISRLQKIHNVQVALNALKEANFVIVGDISAVDIADGHREKTLSLLWQLIHVFRAPLFEKAANVIQIWWRKKYEVIIEKRKEEERILAERDTAASVIQYWWRRIQYNRMAEYKMLQITTATTIIQKYCRMWICRSRLRKLKTSAIKIAEWYKSIKMIREAKEILTKLRKKREELRHKSATLIQANVRRWLCTKQYNIVRTKIILIQSMIRKYLVRKWYTSLMKAVLCIQERYRNKLLMRHEMQKFKVKREKVIIIQSYYRMYKQRKYYNGLKKSVGCIENRYKALLLMRKERVQYLKLRFAAIKIQSTFRCKILRADYVRQRNIIINLQRKVRANQVMKQEREKFLRLRNSIIILQTHIKAYLAMKSARRDYVALKKSVITIQKFFRSYLQMKSQRMEYISLRNTTVLIQRHYRSLLLMRRDRSNYLNLKKSAVVVQRRYRALLSMRFDKKRYQELRNACIVLQRRYKALIKMREDRSEYIKLKSSCLVIQNAYRAYLQGKSQREMYLKQKESAIKIQSWYRGLRKGKKIRKQYEETKKACVTIQKVYRAYILGKIQRQKYLKIKTAAISIQRYYRSYIITKTIRTAFIKMKTSTVIIQRFYRSYLETKKQRALYIKMKQAANVIKNHYKLYLMTKRVRHEYCQLRSAIITVQTKYRSILAMRRDRAVYLRMKLSAIVVQTRYRALQAMRKQRQTYIQQRSAALCLQNRFRAQCIMKKDRSNYLRIKQACYKIQTFYRAYKIGSLQRKYYLKLRESTILVQQKYRAIVSMRTERHSYIKMRSAVLTIQRRYRAQQMMLVEKSKYNKILTSCVTIQIFYRACTLGRKQRQQFVTLKSAVTLIQRRYREILKARQIRSDYIRLRNTVIQIQRRIRTRNIARVEARKMAVSKIQTWYISIKRRDECRYQYLYTKQKIITLQSVIRMHSCRSRYVLMRKAATSIQRFYRLYKLAKSERENYVAFRISLIKLQACVRSFIERKRYLHLRSAVLVIQAIYRLKMHKILLNKKREEAAVSIQKNVRCYLVRSWYKRYIERVILIQTLWREKLLTRLIRDEFLQKRTIILKLQAIIRGYLVRKEVEHKRENLLRLREEQRRDWAASKIQALFRGHKVRLASDKRAKELRRRWRDGALRSTQESLKERNEEAMDVLRNMADIETVIRAFRSLELLTEVMPMIYDANASSIVRRVYIYMSVTNRSISSVEVLKSAASVLVNLARYRVTGPKIYARERIPPVLKFMLRFSNSETQLFCILSTYLWLFSKYDEPRKDLKEFLHIPENHKILLTIKANVMRMKRMAGNARNKFNTPQPSKFVSHTMNQSVRVSMNHSICSSSSYLLPALETDYGITRIDKPRYFEDPQQAIICLFDTYNL